MESFFQTVDTIRISNVEISVPSQSDDEATVEVKYDFQITQNGETTTDHVEDTANLVRETGKWLIADPL